EIHLVVDREQILRLDLVELRRGRGRPAGVVHERLRLQEREARAVEPDVGDLAGELRAPRPAVPPRELVSDHEADVVPRRRVLTPGIAEPDDQEVERRGLLAPTEQAHGLALGSFFAGGVRLRLAALGSCLALALGLGALFTLALDLLAFLELDFL